MGSEEVAQPSWTCNGCYVKAQVTRAINKAAVVAGKEKREI